MEKGCEKPQGIVIHGMLVTSQSSFINADGSVTRFRDSQVVGGAENYVASCRACYHSYNDLRSGAPAAPEPKGTPTSAQRFPSVSLLLDHMSHWRSKHPILVRTCILGTAPCSHGIKYPAAHKAWTIVWCDRPKRRSTRFAAGSAQRKAESPAAAEKVEERRLSLQALTLR